MRDVFYRQAIVLQEIIDTQPEIAFGNVRNIRAQEDVKACIVELPTHDMFCFREEHRPAVHHSRTTFPGKSMVFSNHQYGRGAISKEPGGDQVSQGKIVALDG